MYMHMYLIWHKESFKIEQTRVIISEKNSKPLQVQTTDSIKTALLHPFFILRVVRLQRYGSEKQTWTVGFFFTLPHNLGISTATNQVYSLHKFLHCQSNMYFYSLSNAF